MIQLVGEGKRGEAGALPELVRRLLLALSVYGLEVKGRAIFCHRANMTNDSSELQGCVDLVRYDAQVSALMIVFDADDDCAAQHVPRMQSWIGAANPAFPWAILMVTREYEAWFLASLESFRGRYGVRDDAEYRGDPERVRDCKGVLRRFIPDYTPPTYQAKLTAVMDFRLVYRRCGDFRRLVRAIVHIATELNETPVIPSDWTTPDETVG
jgi:hypothetical protein